MIGDAGAPTRLLRVAPGLLPSVSASAYSTVCNKEDEPRARRGRQRGRVCESAEDPTRVAIRTARILVIVFREKSLFGRLVVEGWEGVGCVFSNEEEKKTKKVGEERVRTLGPWSYTGDAYIFRAPVSWSKSVLSLDDRSRRPMPFRENRCVAP